MLKIGMIDSGMGGFSVLKGLIEGGVNAEYYYLYDNKYHPYGTKSPNELVAIGYKWNTYCQYWHSQTFCC